MMIGREQKVDDVSNAPRFFSSLNLLHFGCGISSKSLKRSIHSGQTHITLR